MDVPGQDTQKHNFFVKFWDKHYKPLMIIPLILMIASIGIIVFHVITTGELIERDVSLKGGVTITVTGVSISNPQELETFLRDNFKQGEVAVRGISGNAVRGIIIESDVQSAEGVAELLSVLERKTGKLTQDQVSQQTVGSSLGASFFSEGIKALLMTFILMSVFVFIYFRDPVPSFFVVLSVVADIIMPFAVLVLFGFKMSTAGMAAFLMLIGYSVDTDILLTTRVLKRTGGTILLRTLDAFRTGMAMSLCALVVALVAYFFTQSETIKQIMFILVLGLIFDILNTWITNAGILRWYLEWREARNR